MGIIRPQIFQLLVGIGTFTDYSVTIYRLLYNYTVFSITLYSYREVCGTLVLDPNCQETSVTCQVFPSSPEAADTPLAVV